MLYDVPAGTQVFGSVALDAGIEGVVYNSVVTRSECLAAFPQNFENSYSYIELDDLAPTDDVQRRLDASNFDQFL